ncbi:MAG: carbohydrate ABC transporter permease [Christensenellales bacterium]
MVTKAPAAVTKASRTRRRKETISAYLFLSPALLVYLFFVIFPLFIVLYLMFHKYNVITPAQWNDYKNFLKAPIDSRIWITLTNSFKFVVLICPMHILFATLLALGVSSIKNRIAVYTVRTVLYFPTLLAVSSCALAWRYIFSTDFGILNWFLGLFGVQKIAWLNSSTWFYPAAMIFSLWKNVGYYFLYIYIALQGIDRSVLEAAELDGAVGARKFFGITLPMISPTLFFVIVTMIIGCIQIFDEPYIFTGGGPGDSTRTFSMYIHSTAFAAQNYGYACVLAMMLLIIVLIITLLQFKASSWVSYDRE